MFNAEELGAMADTIVSLGDKGQFAFLMWVLKDFLSDLMFFFLLLAGGTAAYRVGRRFIFGHQVGRVLGINLEFSSHRDSALEALAKTKEEVFKEWRA